GLYDLIQIERPKITYDAAGVSVKQFPSDTTNPGGLVTYANLPCRVQITEKIEENELGIRGSGGHYEITVGQDLNVTVEDRILLANGLYLDIENYRQPMRIDVLPVIEARRKV